MRNERLETVHFMLNSTDVGGRSSTKECVKPVPAVHEPHRRGSVSPQTLATALHNYGIIRLCAWPGEEEPGAHFPSLIEIKVSMKAPAIKGK